ncbi:MAG: ATP synthase F1 subunit epsilon [Erysipelotrichaceae bacterium]
MLQIRIITPAGLYLTMEASMIQAVSTEGQFCLLPNHMPIVSMLTTSKLALVEQGFSHEYAISGGLLHLLNNQVNILVDTIESKNEINLERALEAKARAEAILTDHMEDNERKTAEVALMKAINRIKIKGE